MVLLQSLRPLAYAADARVLVVRDATSPAAPRHRLLDRVRHAIRVRHLSGHTEDVPEPWRPDIRSMRLA